ncbi:hypothetical protein TrCOL_g9329 [Triparma columacea]|uniref:Uncharacterized protein n=1 Tax=Triparma columacea TaxID=722753 RepID=A0A9W7GJ50_9STRA|nr:hypothetical protein TrCOL_g9329 [Triparma columacea]
MSKSHNAFVNNLRNNKQVSSANSSHDVKLKTWPDTVREVNKTLQRDAVRQQKMELAVKNYKILDDKCSNKKKRISEDVLSMKRIREAMPTGNLKVMIGSKLRTYNNRTEQEDDLTKLDSRLVTKQTELVALTKAKGLAENNRDYIQGKMKESEDIIVALKEEFDSLSARIEANEEKEDAKSRAIFQEALPNMLARVQRLDFLATQQQDKHEELRGEVAVVKGELAVVKGEVAEVKGQVAVNTDLIKEQDARKIAGNTVTLHQAEAAVEKVATLSSENTTLRSENTTLKAQLTEAQRTIAGNTVTLHQAEAAVEEVQAPLRAEVTTLKAHLSGVKAQLSEVKAQFAEAQGKIEKLEKCKPKTPLAVRDLNCE